jgi:hypothetical protein
MAVARWLAMAVPPEGIPAVVVGIITFFHMTDRRISCFSIHRASVGEVKFLG